MGKFSHDKNLHVHYRRMCKQARQNILVNDIKELCEYCITGVLLYMIHSELFDHPS